MDQCRGGAKRSSKEGGVGSWSGVSCPHAICSYLALLMFLARQQARITPMSGKKATPRADPPTKPMFPFKNSTTLLKHPCNTSRKRSETKKKWRSKRRRKKEEMRERSKAWKEGRREGRKEGRKEQSFCNICHYPHGKSCCLVQVCPDL